MQTDDNHISKNLLSLLGNPRRNSEGLYEIQISALPLEPVLDPALGFIEFPHAEVFKLDSKAKYDVVFGYDFFHFHGKDLFLGAQRWHVIYEEFAMARLQAEALATTVRRRMQFMLSEIAANIHSIWGVGGQAPVCRVCESLSAKASKAIRKDTRNLPYRAEKKFGVSRNSQTVRVLWR